MIISMLINAVVLWFTIGVIMSVLFMVSALKHSTYDEGVSKLKHLSMIMICVLLGPMLYFDALLNNHRLSFIISVSSVLGATLITALIISLISGGA
jgi:predicted permease